jgi:hypothetical protein
MNDYSEIISQEIEKLRDKLKVPNPLTSVYLSIFLFLEELFLNSRSLLKLEFLFILLQFL